VGVTVLYVAILITWRHFGLNTDETSFAAGLTAVK